MTNPIRRQWLRASSRARRYGAPIGQYQREDYLLERQGLAERVAEHAEGGVVAIVYGGMDCDCSRWDDRVAIVPATATHVRVWIDRYHEGAEGPQWTRICRPSEAPTESSSRDLALEAFEDGHPHVVYV